MSSTNHNADDAPQAKLRRVVIDDEPRIVQQQRRTLEHVRQMTGYGDDVSPNAHNPQTFKLINQRKELDQLRDADVVVPMLDNWKHWSKMNDWDSRNRLLENLTGKMRRGEATTGEIQVLVTVCRPTWMKIAGGLRRYGHAALDVGADGALRRVDAQRVNELDRDELDQVMRHALLDALSRVPSKFPWRFFSWLESVLAHRALDHVAKDLTEHTTVFPEDVGIKEVIEHVLADSSREGASFFRSPTAPAHDQWLRTLDIDAIFELSHEYATYARTRSACERAVERLPSRQRQVIQGHYFDAMTQEQVATSMSVTSSTVRSTHQGALRNLHRDNELFDVLVAVGKVRDHARKQALERSRRAA